MEKQPNKAPIDNKNEEKLSKAKKSVHRKPPVIKQTLTSMYRIARANPLLVLKDRSEAQLEDYGVNNIKLPKSILHPSVNQTADDDKPTVTNGHSVSVTKQSINKNGPTSGLKPATFTRAASLRIKETSTSCKVLLKRTNSVNVPASSCKFEPKRPLQQNKKVSNVVAIAVKPTHVDKKTKKNGKRRSLSAEHFDRKKNLGKTQPEQLVERKGVTQSLNDIPTKLALQPPVVSPIVEEIRTVTFKTPSEHTRRSMITSYYTSTPYYGHSVSTRGPTHNDLRRRLEEWLRKHQKPVDSYKHLKCFGLNHPSHQSRFTQNKENKENVEVNLSQSSSYEDLRIVPENGGRLTPVITIGDNDIDNRTVAREALGDLHRLILDGYSHEQCEAWLGMIRQKYRDLDEEPQYWECRAAIEQTRGNITSAVECLRTAIVQGAEVKSVEHSLEQLLQKFSLLNISTSEQDKDNATKNDRARIVLDARNVFKSSIIQFAVQERTMKKNQKHGETKAEKKYIVTPVRRSTRLNRSAYTSTAGVNLCTSLQELDETVRSSLDFRANNALADKFYC